MHKLKKKFYTNFLFLLMITNQFTICEFYNAKAVMQLNNEKKPTYENKPSERIGNLKRFLLKFTVYNTVMFVAYVASNLLSEWREGRKLTFIERELQMINLSLAWIIASNLYENSIFCSPQNENPENKLDQKAQVESSCILQA